MTPKEQIKNFRLSFAEGLSHSPNLTVSEWADKYRRLSSESSAEPGEWDTSRAEYQRGIMDIVNDPTVEEVVFMASSQVGKTEILNNIVGFYMAEEPSPILVLQPTVEMAQTWSKDRLSPMLRDTPRLAGTVKDAKSRVSDNTILHKTFPGGHITMTGANSPASLASRPIRILLLDEVDRFPASAGSEGDPVGLAMKRTQTFWNRKIILVSTPTIKGASRIETAFDASDKRYYYMPCPRCKKEIIFLWPFIKFDKNNLDDIHLECPECKGRIEESEKFEMIRAGHWKATAESKIAGFHINELYSPWSSWSRIAREFLKAKKHPEQLKVFINTCLGETWEDQSINDIDEAQLLSRCEDYSKVPKDCLLLTAAADVQDDRIEFKVKGYGKDEESWIIYFHIIYGIPNVASVWNELDKLFLKTFEGENGYIYPIACGIVDSGGHFTNEVYEFTRSRENRRIFAAKGVPGDNKPIASRISRVYTKGGAPVALFNIGTFTAKELIASRLMIKDFGPGYMHFNKQFCDLEYFQQLTAERQVITYKKGTPTREWKKRRPRNEALDLEVYNLAAVNILNPDWDALADMIAEETQQQQTAAREPEKLISFNILGGR